MRPITRAEFGHFQQFIFQRAGITLADSKQALVTGRLGKRLALQGLDSFGEYFELLQSGSDPAETQTAIDLLTTNETYFFREAKHFDFLAAQAQAAKARGATFRVWSAASSSGEEAWSVAMVLADHLGDSPWEVLGTDISLHVLQQAARGLYTMERARHVPPGYLRRFCLRGTGDYQGRLLMAHELRQRVRFGQINLNAPLPDVGSFDLVLLRNVMIYFSNETKQAVLSRLAPAVRPGGHFCVGHSESLNGLEHRFVQVAPAIYQRPA